MPIISFRPALYQLIMKSVVSNSRAILMLVSDAYGSNGGVAKFNRDLIQAACMDQSVSRVTVIPRSVTRSGKADFPKLVYREPATEGKFMYAWTIIKWLLRFEKVDIVISGHINLSPFALIIGKVKSARTSIVIHGIDAWTPRANIFVNFCCRRLESIISVSKLTLERYKKWAHPTSSREFLLPNAVDDSLFVPGPKNDLLIDRYGLAGKKIVMTLGRLVSQERQKGFDEVLEVILELRKKIPNLVYVIAGDGPDRQRLMRKARSLGVEESVVFTGHVSEAEKLEHYRLADAFVMPSRGEGFGIVLLEAMACGVPVVGSSADGCREALLDGRLGALVDPSRPEEILIATTAALSLPKMRPAGLEHYSSANFLKRWELVSIALREDSVACK